MLKGKVLIAQGGGPTAVINQSLVGAVVEAKKLSGVEHIYGAVHGIRGIVNEDFLDLGRETVRNLESVADTPCSALGSTRDKPDVKYCREIFKVLKAHEIGTFLYIGGNDSSDALRILGEEAGKADYDLRGIHIPKTIDNDLMINDHTPGFPSAARFVAAAFAGIDKDNAALPGVYVGVVMGRHAGFLTASAALARSGDNDGPHLIYLPERSFDIASFVADVKSVYQRLGRCVIAVSEGIHDQSGAPIITTLSGDVEKDAHGNVQLSGTGALADMLTAAIKNRSDIKRVRGDTFGYLQRSFLGCVSDIDRKEAREVGAKGIQYADQGHAAGSVTIHRVGDYAVEYRLTPLNEVAGKTRVMDDSMISPSANDVTGKFLDYARPLIGGDFPKTARLDVANRVEKILGK
ncbi:MAG: 6-phosphofructokinase [Rhodospirillales bacterium RIFCSPLOWO2_12_FULL_58_28]|nr:MAG: 6-phosphofructokinase [Rhodospirillales bacterium RIFCSPLOWO2_02_FULL_58_16]OHC76894.1 MAG: 6-phosphofructokinase [Rhodospirillales bacterium RIFCSPLOWO2_12_FULL_58_28]